MQGLRLKSEPRTVFVVDLDFSLIKTDLLIEKMIVLVRRSPFSLFRLPLILFRGRLAFKKWLNQKMVINPSTLPYRLEVIQQVESAKSRGEITVLCSASLQEDVDRVAKHLKIFDEAIGSTEENLKGPQKLACLRSRFKGDRLTYLGDSTSDLFVWRGSDKVIAVNPTLRLQWQLKKLNKPYEFLFDNEKFGSLIFQQLRTYQWIKNLLVFLPVFAAHRFADLQPWLDSFRAFVSFSFLASAIYVFNDICDLPYDRLQNSKKNRPLASGRLPLAVALVLVPVCLGISGFVASGLPLSLSAVLACYVVMNVCYSFWIKEWIALDVVFLSLFYTLRIFAGSMASGVKVSEWLLSFSIFFFFGLAMVKRCSEVKKTVSLYFADKIGRRSYQAQDLTVILVSGCSASLLSILILALYLSTGEVKKLYRHHHLLWFLTPCLLFWLNRLWILGARGQVNEDPLVFALKDRSTWLVMLIALMVILLAI